MVAKVVRVQWTERMVPPRSSWVRAASSSAVGTPDMVTMCRSMPTGLCRHWRRSTSGAPESWALGWEAARGLGMDAASVPSARVGVVNLLMCRMESGEAGEQAKVPSEGGGGTAAL